MTYTLDYEVPGDPYELEDALMEESRWIFRLILSGKV